MARNNILPSYDQFGAPVTRASIDDLLRPSLRWAFPLPDKAHADDERFLRVLNALARHRGET